jgi:hypothetical protein
MLLTSQTPTSSLPLTTAIAMAIGTAKDLAESQDLPLGKEVKPTARE